jgi:hypothetical protein
MFLSFLAVFLQRADYQVDSSSIRNLEPSNIKQVAGFLIAVLYMFNPFHVQWYNK